MKRLSLCEWQFSQKYVVGQGHRTEALVFPGRLLLIKSVSTSSPSADSGHGICIRSNFLEHKDYKPIGQKYKETETSPFPGSSNVSLEFIFSILCALTRNHSNKGTWVNLWESEEQAHYLVGGCFISMGNWWQGGHVLVARKAITREEYTQICRTYLHVGNKWVAGHLYRPVFPAFLLSSTTTPKWHINKANMLLPTLRSGHIACFVCYSPRWNCKTR